MKIRSFSAGLYHLIRLEPVTTRMVGMLISGDCSWLRESYGLFVARPCPGSLGGAVMAPSCRADSD